MMTFEQAKELRNSSIWEAVKTELDYRIESKVAILRTCSVTDLREIQQTIRALESFKRLPDDVVDREAPIASGSDLSVN